MTIAPILAFWHLKSAYKLIKVGKNTLGWLAIFGIASSILFSIIVMVVAIYYWSIAITNSAMSGIPMFFVFTFGIPALIFSHVLIALGTVENEL